ncbi:hypothetical protein [Enterobacter asburiae]|uniref:hypothetical protein n=1 Tax=Enterobacter asburiae TaxID=61645 RepID=UPI0011D1A69D|nr:hypothetical protein [Enterobacter asburiae]
MSNNESTSFFLICSPITINYEKKHAEATLFLKKWTFSQHHLPITMVFEGINQFACTLAMKLYPDDHSDFYVPNIIEDFDANFDIKSSVVNISGWAEECHGLCRVVCNIYDNVKGVNVSSAVVLVNKAHSYNQKKMLTAHDPDIKMWNIKSVPQRLDEVESFEFSFNIKHPLFREHFPGHPVVPGSMLFEIAFNQIYLRNPGMVSFKMEKIKFIRGVIPECAYTLHLKKTRSSVRNSVIISYIRDNKRYASGKLLIESKIVDSSFE